MDTHFLLTSDAFGPTAGELDEHHDDFINPGLFALKLGDFLASGLERRGQPVRFRCQEDWGHWLEMEHSGKFTLAIGCANTGSAVQGKSEHRVFIVPDKPVIRRFFSKIDVRTDVETLSMTLRRMLEDSPKISNLRVRPSVDQ